MVYSKVLFFTHSNMGRRHVHQNHIKPKLETIWDKRVYKGLSYTIEERQFFGIIGLIPPTYRTFEEQLKNVKSNFDRYKEPLNKYKYLTALRSRNERLFYGFIKKHIEDCLQILYTPTVGAASQNFGIIYQIPFGIYITKYDRCHIKDVLKNWRSEVTAVCVTDGERILGLGDLGASGMPISVGKLQLYTALGGINPSGLLPIVIDVGTNNKSLLKDPQYIGIRERRLKGQEYDDLIEEFMEAVVSLHGSSCLIHFEDFATPNAFKLLKKYRDKYCCFNDDIQGTAATGLAGFLAASRLRKQKLQDQKFLFAGAGSASLGIAILTVEYLVANGTSRKDAQDKIFMYDVDGLVTKDRKDVPEMIQNFAKDHKPIKKLEEVVASIKPNVLLGATGVPKIFNEQVLTEMGKATERPIIFALSNPTSRSECSAEEAYRFTQGRAIFSSGSPFPPVVWEGKTFTPGQSNNSLIFPGVALGVMASKAKHIPTEMFLIAAQTCSEYTEEDRLNKGSLFPPISVGPELSFKIGVKIATYAFEKGLASVYPVPKDICEFVKSQVFVTDYGDSIHPTWKYPSKQSASASKCE